MGWTSRGLIALGWLATVSATSSVIWWVISTTGTQVGTLPQVHFPASQASASPRTEAAGTGSWSGSGGRIVARCDQGQVSLRSAVPNDGFSVEIAERGPSELRVEFDRADKSGEQKVRVTCGAEGPIFRVN